MRSRREITDVMAITIYINWRVAEKPSFAPPEVCKTETVSSTLLCSFNVSRISGTDIQKHLHASQQKPLKRLTGNH